MPGAGTNSGSGLLEPPHLRPARTPGTRYAVPADVLYALERVFGQPRLGRIAVIYRPRYVRAHLLFIGARTGSVTRPERIYTSIPESMFFGLDAHVLHEYYHVVQQWGRERMTRLGYLLGCKKREREARNFASCNLQLYRGLRKSAALQIRIDGEIIRSA